MTYQGPGRYRVVSWHPTWGEDSTMPLENYYAAVEVRAWKLAHCPWTSYTIEKVEE